MWCDFQIDPIRGRVKTGKRLIENAWLSPEKIILKHLNWNYLMACLCSRYNTISYWPILRHYSTPISTGDMFDLYRKISNQDLAISLAGQYGKAKV